MSIFRAGVYSAAATAAKLVTGLVLVKLVAAYSGPAGIAKFGQFLSLMAVANVFAGGGIGQGVVKFVSEYRDNPQRYTRFIETATAYTIICGLFLALIFCLFNKYFAHLLLGDERQFLLIIATACAQPIIGMHTFFVSIVNGFMDIRRTAIISIAASLVGLCAAALLTAQFKLNGALYAILIAQVIQLFISYPLFKFSPWFDSSIFRPRIHWDVVRPLAQFSLMTLTSALLSPLVQIWVRNHLSQQFSWQGAGYWQAVSKVSEAYLLCITTGISLYYLPALSGLRTKLEIKAELKRAYLLIMPAVIFLALIVYIFRDVITELLFSQEFLSARILYAPQLIGDVLRIASFLLSYLMIAKAMTKLFIASEIIFSASYVLLVNSFTAKFGLVGVCYAFSTNYFLYLIFNIFIVHRYMKGIE